MFDQFNLSGLAVLAVVPILGFLIFVHELGHFLAARWMGVRVREFGFGYPPRMLKLFERNGVEYTLNWLPLGGFVKMVGEQDDFDGPGSLAAAPPLRRAVVLAAGSFMNIVTAVVLFAVLLAVVGVPRLTVDPAGLRVQIEAVAPDSPAAAAGLQVGDVFLTIDGVEVFGPENVSNAIRAGAGRPVVIVVERAGQPLTVSVVPRLPAEIPPGQGAIGVRIAAVIPPDAVTRERMGVGQALVAGVTYTVRFIGLMIEGLSGLLRGLIGQQAAMPEGGVGGPVAIARITAEVARQGWADLIELTAILSLNLAVINLLPIPALDGGRLFFVLVEGIRRKRIPPEKEALVHLAGFALLLGLMALITVVDVQNWLAGRPPLP
ncbi:MAG: site-2 protease family protein [Caldilineales bacterium]|nr:site-2 protease family protein [Caldilineales bacterium]MDW8267907.1 M50 family metallopeptidase [Anaerolineae bacterium]